MFLKLRPSLDYFRFAIAIATALAIGKKVYQEATKSWITGQNINGDAEWPGVMPPSRAQITSHVVANGGSIDAVNLNIDDVELLKRFLRAANVPERDVIGFSADVLANRKMTESGMPEQYLVSLLGKYNLQKTFKIAEMSFLIFSQSFNYNMSLSGTFNFFPGNAFFYQTSARQVQSITRVRLWGSFERLILGSSLHQMKRMRAAHFLVYNILSNYCLHSFRWLLSLSTYG
ncbi:hypothetical protein DdX_21179 [Ditylenchus destructor]|uniref:Uncharacterized protein n=1 Tax=Ditylenchus destructor TaxID=166010 RepID=A0AAD4MF92_9BILA|nr:hypothetical protein DdX_21179 [Ditylenchus destructor]